jgi:hypothetical protein
LAATTMTLHRRAESTVQIFVDNRAPPSLRSLISMLDGTGILSTHITNCVRR